MTDPAIPLAISSELSALLARADEAVRCGSPARAHDLIISAYDRVSELTDFSEQAEVDAA